MKLKTQALLGALFVVGVGYVLLCPASEAERAQQPQNDQMGELRASLDELTRTNRAWQARVNRLEAQLANGQDAPATTQVQIEATPVGADDRADDQPPADTRVEAVEPPSVAESLNAIVEREAVDPGWSNAARAQLEEVFDRESFRGVTLLNVACRTTLCRFELRFDQGVEPSDTMRQFQIDQPWNSEAYFKVDLETQRAALYLAREGHPLFPKT